MQPQDILFFHITAGNSTESSDIPLIPIGTFYLADYLSRRGWRCRIVHKRLLEKREGKGSVENLISAARPLLLGIDLHWHYQSRPVLEFARRVKKRFPALPLVLGGSTATFFAQEILQASPFIDAVVRGDAEAPLASLLEAVRSGGDWGLVPNLAWRRAQKVICNPQTHVYCDKEFAEARYPCLDLLVPGKEAYLDLTARAVIGKEGRAVIYNPTRGCSGSCVFCGGSRGAQKLLYGRERLLVADVAGAMRTFAILKKEGVDFVFFPLHVPQTERFYLGLFQRLRKEKFGLGARMDSYHLPDPAFIETFASTFKKFSKIVLSPDTGSDHLRKKIRTFYYSNETLMDRLKVFAAAGVEVDLHFSTGFPYETPADFEKTLKLICVLKRRFPVNIYSSSILLDPASSMYLEPRRYGCVMRRRDFSVFTSRHSGSFPWGYRTKSFGERRISLMNKILWHACRDGCEKKSPALAEA